MRNNEMSKKIRKIQLISSKKAPASNTVVAEFIRADDNRVMKIYSTSETIPCLITTFFENIKSMASEVKV